MKAAILVDLNHPLEVAELALPRLDIGQVKVQLHCSTICGAQVGEISGIKGRDKFLPHLLGHEGGGVVLEVGPGVTLVKPGDHVVLHWRKGTGIQSSTPRYQWEGRTVNAGWVATFADQAIVSENRITRIEDDIPFEIASLLGCAVTTALGLINRDAKVQIGEAVAVIGCGGIGLNVVQGAAMVSADPIIAIDIYDHKLDMAKRFGATHVINSMNDDPSEMLAKVVGMPDQQTIKGKPSESVHMGGIDVVVENTGNVDLIEMAYQFTKPRTGRTILVGVPRHDHDITIHSLPLHYGQVLTGSEGGHTNPTIDIPRYLNLYRKGKLELDSVITHRFPLAEINRAFDLMRAGEVGRCAITMT